MADTSPAANNRPVAYRGKPEREMSAVSTPKSPAIHAAEEVRPPAVKKLSKAVRKNANRAIKRGMISPKAAKRHLGGA